MTRSSVKASTKRCRSGSPVRLRIGATATAMLGSRHGHCGLCEPGDGRSCVRGRWLSTTRSAITLDEGRA